MKRNNADSLVFLQVSVSAFFLLLGLVGMVNYDSDASRFGREVVRFFGGRNDVLALLTSILSFISGIVLLLGLFSRISSRVVYLTGLGVLVFWSLHILYFFFFNNIFEPNFLVWLQQLSPEAVILVSVWIVARKYS